MKRFILLILLALSCAGPLKNIDSLPCYMSTRVCPTCICVIDSVIAWDFSDGSIKRVCPKCGAIWFEKPLYKCLGGKKPRESRIYNPRAEWEDAK